MKQKQMKRISILVAIVMLCSISPYSVNAALTTTVSTNASQLATSLLPAGSTLTIQNPSCTGDLRSFSDGTDSFGIASGILLSTDGQNSTTQQDPDLAAIIQSSNVSYGGHTAKLEFTLVSTGTLLSFNYIFASKEFNQSANYNDSFGLFIKINDGDYENIALLSNGEPVNITSLRAGYSKTNMNSGADTNLYSIDPQQDYFKVKSFSIPGDTDSSGGNFNGVSNVFTAQKTVAVNDTVTIKMVIADVGDTGYNSAVAIAGGTLSFSAPNTVPDYPAGTIANFEAGQSYKITTGGQTYNFTASSSGTIPSKGTYNGNSYDFIGKTLSVIKLGSGSDPDSDAQTLVVASPPSTPSAPTVPTNTTADFTTPDVSTTNTSITVKAITGQEYSIDNGTTWVQPNSSGLVNFTGLTSGSTYNLITRKSATSLAPSSAVSSSSAVIAQPMVVPLTTTNYTGVYDGSAHTATFTPAAGATGVSITYSTTETGTYSAQAPTRTDVGSTTIYYCAEKSGCYSAYGTATSSVTKKSIIATPNAGQRKNVGVADSVITYSLSPAITGQTPSVAGALARDTGETVGTYPIKIGTLTLQDNGAFKASNYSLALADNYTYQIVAPGSSVPVQVQSAPNRINPNTSVLP